MPEKEIPPARLVDIYCYSSACQKLGLYRVRTVQVQQTNILDNPDLTMWCFNDI